MWIGTTGARMVADRKIGLLAAAAAVTVAVGAGVALSNHHDEAPSGAANLGTRPSGQGGQAAVDASTGATMPTPDATFPATTTPQVPITITPLPPPPPAATDRLPHAGVAPGAPTTSSTGAGAGAISAEYEQAVSTVGVDAHSAARPDEFITMHRSDGPGWLASDGTLSTRLPDGRVLWLYGDTIIGNAANGRITHSDGFMRNSMVVQDGTERTTLIKRDATGAAVGSILPRIPGEWYWPGQPFIEGDAVKFLVGRVHMTEEGAPGWNFAGSGADLVTLDANDLSLRSIEPFTNDTKVTWGGDILQDGDWTYMTGTYDDEEWSPALVVARAPAGQFGPSTMEYWNGESWTHDPASVKPITHASDVTMLRTDNGFALVTQGFPFGRQILVQNAPRPEGPWSEPRQVGEIPPLPEHSITYGGKTHPEYSDGDQLLFSYNINRDDGTISPELGAYRPSFISIPRDKLNAP